MPTGQGFADLVFIPKKEFPDVPAMILELKWNQAAETALRQIKEKKYDSILDSYHGNVLLGVSVILITTEINICEFFIF